MAGLPIAQHHKTNQKTIIIHTSQTFFVVISSKRIILIPFLACEKFYFHTNLLSFSSQQPKYLLRRGCYIFHCIFFFHCFF